ncbi:J domain-containing protein [Streptomyces sp. NPDC005409]|uniref:J domain-containing protein n=1 Tax=Streptomyces sp. NPDC005409 TaxID=3155342 RepID=UPI0034512135
MVEVREMGGSRPPRDHYTVLGLPAEASPRQITSAYRALIRALHPDARPDRPTTEGELAEVIDAYRTLHDPLRRTAYDAERDRERQTATRQRVRIPVRVRSVPGTTARPFPPPAERARERTRPMFRPAAPAPHEDPFDSFDRLMAWLLYRI